jgi:NTP pyrophosphatase (non-canonical NTP hydrolase)
MSETPEITEKSSNELAVDHEFQTRAQQTLEDLIYYAHRTMTDHFDFWEDEREVGTLIALMHAELSEALEADRKDLMDDKLPEYHGVEAELADVVIRILDFAGAKGLDLPGAIMDKIAYNITRDYGDKKY